MFLPPDEVLRTLSGDAGSRFSGGGRSLLPGKGGSRFSGEDGGRFSGDDGVLAGEEGSWRTTEDNALEGICAPPDINQSTTKN